MVAVGAVLLAAGQSQRFGADNKLLAELGGKAILRRVAEALQQSGVQPIVVVTGHDRPGCESALEGLAVTLVHNPAWPSGMGGSIAAGVGVVELDASLDGAFIVPGDMPLLPAPLLATMIQEFDCGRAQNIVFPVTGEGEQRNPVLWPRRFFPALAALTGPEGAKHILQSHLRDARRVTVSDASAVADIDTPAELRALGNLPDRP